jgi:cobalt-zinc-cadmium efflux system membrane fusion protein
MLGSISTIYLVRFHISQLGSRPLTESQDHIQPLPGVKSLDQKAQLRLIAYVAIGIAALVIGISGLRALLAPAPKVEAPVPKNAFRPTPDQLAQFGITPVSYGAIDDVVRATGSIAVDADHSTPIILPFSGQVVDVMVGAGARVVRGQPLLRIASPELVDARSTLLSAAAQQASTAEALRIATENAARQKAIYETAGGALKDYQQAQADLVTAQSNARAAQSTLRAAQDRLALFGKSTAETRALQSPWRALGGQPSTIYRAPVSGIVADRNIAPGQFVGAGGSTALMTIADLSRVWLIAQLPENEAANVHLGDAVVVTTPALPGQQFSAVVDNIAASLDPATHRLPVRATVTNANGLLKPQMFASFAIRRTLNAESSALVPTGAVIHEGDSARVWVLGRDGLLYGREVVIGETEGGYTKVLKGLRPGDRVATTGALFINEAGLDG